MFSGGAKLEQVLIYFLGISAAMVIPCLTVMAYRSWAKRWRQELPLWRSALGMTSIAVTLVSWLSLVILGALALSARMGIKANFFSPDWIPPIALLTFAGTSLAFALRGASRIEAVAAGLLVVAAWLTSVVS